MGIEIDVQPIYDEYQRRKNYSFSSFVPELDKLSAILITKNEEKNICRCLDSLHFVDEVIVVDSGSTDQTCAMARKYPNVVLVETQWFGFVENKKIAIEKTKNDWILWVDADEVVPEELAKEWEKIVSAPLFHETGAIDVARKTFFLDNWVRHSGWYPNRTIRFFHKKRAQLSESILHESIQVKPGYKTDHFNTDLLHYSYTSLYQYFDKMNYYGIAGAKEIIRKKKKAFLPQLILQPIWTFFRFYILKKGFLDGRIGIIVCMGAAFSNFIKYSNYFFLKKYQKVSQESDTSST